MCCCRYWRVHRGGIEWVGPALVEVASYAASRVDVRSAEAVSEGDPVKKTEHTNPHILLPFLVILAIELSNVIAHGKFGKGPTYRLPGGMYVSNSRCLGYLTSIGQDYELAHWLCEPFDVGCMVNVVGWLACLELGGVFFLRIYQGQVVFRRENWSRRERGSNM